jgi:hypothetical protein
VPWMHGTHRVDRGGITSGGVAALLMKRPRAEPGAITYPDKGHWAIEAEGGEHEFSKHRDERCVVGSA